MGTISEEVYSEKVISARACPLTVHPSTTRIGWIGTGIMGSAMVRHLLTAGYGVSVFNRTRSKAEPLLESGAVWCESPAAVASRSDIVFTMVGYPRDVEEVVLGRSGIMESWQTTADSSCPRIFVDMTTSSPELARRLEQRLAASGVVALDAPVSGGDSGAREATLSIMVGGNRTAFESLTPLWQCMGKEFVWQGLAGAGQATKMVNQILIAHTISGVCEAILYAEQSGLDLNRVFDSVSGGAAGSWQLSNLGRKIMAGDFDPGFMILHFVKDMGIALDEAKKMNLSLPGLELAKRRYDEAVREGDERSGTQALIRSLRKHLER